MFYLASPNFPQNPSEPVTFIVWVQNGLFFSTLPPPTGLTTSCPSATLCGPSEERARGPSRSTDSSSQQLEPKKSLSWSSGRCWKHREPLTPGWGYQSGFDFLCFCPLPAQLMGLSWIQDSCIRNMASTVLTLPEGSCHWTSEGNLHGMPLNLVAFQNAEC